MKKWLNRLRGGDESTETAMETGIIDAGENPVEVDVVGEARYQDNLERLAGRKQAVGKEHRVGVTLRCEPTNQYDPNAVRVESMGLVVGYLPKQLAAGACAGMSRHGGAVEGQGLIVGGWKDGSSEGSFGIRVWLREDDAQRVGIARQDAPQLPPPTPNEIRLSPADGDVRARVSVVTVTCEEHYQPAIETTRPPGRLADWWPCVATLEMVPTNPHTKTARECVEVRLGGQPAGHLTAAMTERHSPAIRAALAAGRTATARAQVHTATKGDTSILRVKLDMLDPRTS